MAVGMGFSFLYIYIYIYISISIGSKDPTCGVAGAASPREPLQVKASVSRVGTHT